MPPAPPAAQELEALSREVFDTTLRRSPSLATSLGIHDYDREVSDPRRAAVLEDIRLHQGWLGRADALSARAPGLTPAQRVDLEALRYSLRLWLHEEQATRSWEKNPDFAMELLDHVFGLLVKEDAPLDARCTAIAARLGKAAWYLEGARDRIREAPALWVDMALESCTGTPALLGAVEQLAQGAGSGPRQEVHASVKEAREALSAHEAWLRGLRAKATEDGWAIGAAMFNERVALRQLGADADTILVAGERLVTELRASTQRAAEALLRKASQGPGADVVQQAIDLIAAEHPKDWPAVLEAYRTSIRASRDFVAKRGVATLPPGERLDVLETPAYLRHILPFAAYISPGKFEQQQVGLYLVTPREPKEFPMAEVLNTTVHEGYPGHHLQLTGANANPSLARQLVHATESIEGWAHYCEEMMLAKGFGAGLGHGIGSSPEAVRFVVLKDQLWRACRIVIDVKLHRGAMSFEEGWRMLHDVARMGEPQAQAEIKRYTQSPAYQLSYLWGKLEIQKLRSAAEAKGMAERAFHDRYVAAGSLPLGLMRQEMGL